MVRPKLAWLAAALFCVRIAGAEFTIDQRGKLSIRSGGTVLLDRETLNVVNADGKSVADLLATHLAGIPEEGATRSYWASDIGSIVRTVRRRADGTVDVEWRVRLLNGITEGRSLALGFSRPDGRANISIAGSPPPLCRTARPSDAGRCNVVLLQPYTPAEVNEYSITLAVSER